jgi:hypothetical protein
MELIGIFWTRNEYETKLMRLNTIMINLEEHSVQTLNVHDINGLIASWLNK